MAYTTPSQEKPSIDDNERRAAAAALIRYFGLSICLTNDDGDLQRLLDDYVLKQSRYALFLARPLVISSQRKDTAGASLEVVRSLIDSQDTEKTKTDERYITNKTIHERLAQYFTPRIPKSQRVYRRNDFEQVRNKFANDLNRRGVRGKWSAEQHPANLVLSGVAKMNQPTREKIQPTDMPYCMPDRALLEVASGVMDQEIDEALLSLPVQLFSR